MPKFTVTATKRIPGERHPNPFLIRDIFDKRWAATVERRTWEIEAKDEAEIRRLFAEAKDRFLEPVDGFEIASITAL